MRDFSPKQRYDIADLVRVIAALRNPDGGCPWDLEQTHASIRKNFIEETYEAVDAIDREDAEGLREELGDVLLQVLLHSQMEAEAGRFTFDDVCHTLAAKLIHRHPHVFGEVVADTAEAVLQNWDTIKRAEKQQHTSSAAVADVPASLPALMRAQKMQKRAAKSGYGFKDATAAAAAAAKAADALGQAQGEAQKSAAATRLLQNAVAATRLSGLDAEELLDLSCRRFATGFQKLEQETAQSGDELANEDPEALF